MGGQDHHLIIFLYVLQFHDSAATKYHFASSPLLKHALSENHSGKQRSGGVLGGHPQLASVTHTSAQCHTAGLAALSRRSPADASALADG